MFLGRLTSFLVIDKIKAHLGKTVLLKEIKLTFENIPFPFPKYVFHPLKSISCQFLL